MALIPYFPVLLFEDCCYPLIEIGKMHRTVGYAICQKFPIGKKGINVYERSSIQYKSTYIRYMNIRGISREYPVFTYSLRIW
jgi:hypothetical protein